MLNVPPSQHDSDSPSTYFAPAARASAKELKECLSKITNNPVLDTTLKVVGGWVAVLNRQRQILAVNNTLLQALGIGNAAEAVGLRPGEALNCAHANDHTGGCGTSKFCSTCGAAIAMLATQDLRETHERLCVITTGKDDDRLDRVFLARCSPLVVAGEDLLLICLRDVSAEQRRIALERTFLHDVSNILTALVGSTDMLSNQMGASKPKLMNSIQESADILMREVNIQRLLSRDSVSELDVSSDKVLPSDVLTRIEVILSEHATSLGQSVVVQYPRNEMPFETDLGLLVRVLVNMVVNGLEAGGPNSEVRIGAESIDSEVVFKVWNDSSIPENVSLRIFQKYFSTKSGGGRGLGTFAMKLIGESLLKGRVSFCTSETGGTTFRIALPVDPNAADA